MAYPTPASGPAPVDIGLPPQLYAGDTPPLSTQDFSITVTGAPIPQYTPLQRSAAGVITPWAAGAAVFAVAMYPIPVGTSRAALATEAMFNIDALAWPAGTTEAQAMAGMSGNVKYRKLLYSDKRTGGEPTTAGPGSEAGPSA